MNMMFDLFDLIFPVMVLLIFGMILFTFISGIRTWNKNNNSPRLTVEARVAAKRQNTTHHNEPVGGDTSGTHGYHTTTSTSYYVTFEVESGDRMEFSVYGEDYGMLAEGDEGKLQLVQVAPDGGFACVQRLAQLLYGGGALPRQQIQNQAESFFCQHREHSPLFDLSD